MTTHDHFDVPEYTPMLPMIGDNATPYMLITRDNDRHVAHIEYHCKLSDLSNTENRTIRYPLILDVAVHDNIAALTVTIGRDNGEKYALHEEFEFTGKRPLTLGYAVIALGVALENLTEGYTDLTIDIAGRIQRKLHQEYFDALKQLEKRRITNPPATN
ncbi:hypothetical protein [Corynebacterium minutissimum]|uniref:Uncharacterized protein n=1 Tax=Corynebacterium minutissimum TaxID=38301 RepID=A0A376CWI1_9CORY|nr:hypothetical protein [Corynebacterium minutissimum]QRP60659.1 hypothetical protein I6J26_10985 [Corynebacterium minutissimum]STC76724.1 Uncharacterised protein [Corynebacterium minutissimum]